MKNLLPILALAFAILTSPAEAKQRPHFDPSSLSRVEYDYHNCKRDDTGVGCTEAILTFSKYSAQAVSLPEEEQIIFLNPINRKWVATVVFHPRKCSPWQNPQKHTEFLQEDKFVCRDVAWRMATPEAAIGTPER